MGGGKGAGAIRSLGNARGLQLQYARVLNEVLLMPVLMYGSETMIWKGRRDLGLGLYRMDKRAVWSYKICGWKD